MEVGHTKNNIRVNSILINPRPIEYISIEKLEAVYRENPLVEQLLVYADPSHYDCTAIVVPDEKKLLQWAKERGFDSYSYEKLLNEPATKAFVLKSLQATARNAGVRLLFRSSITTFLIPLDSLNP